MKDTSFKKIGRITDLLALVINEMEAFYKADLSNVDNNGRIIDNLLMRYIAIIERDIICAYERISILGSCLDEKKGE